MKLWWKVFWEEFSAIIGGTLAVVGSVILAAAFMFLVLYLTPWLRSAQFMNMIAYFMGVSLTYGAILKFKRVHRNYKKEVEYQNRRERIEDFVDKTMELNTALEDELAGIKATKRYRGEE